MAKFAEFKDKDVQAFFKEFKKNADSPEIKKILNEAVTKVGNIAVKEVKERTPVDTGELRRGWNKKSHVSGTSAEVEISNAVEYAPFIENGHRIVRGGRTHGYVEGQHMLSTTVDDMEPVLDQIAKEALDRIADKLFGGL